jgi:hypothetical protein
MDCFISFTYTDSTKLVSGINQNDFVLVAFDKESQYFVTDEEYAVDLFLKNAEGLNVGLQAISESDFEKLSPSFPKRNFSFIGNKQYLINSWGINL